MKVIVALLAVTFAGAATNAGPVLPIENGTSWRYNMTEEAGEGLAFSQSQDEYNAVVRLPVLYRIDGVENVDGRDLLKFEMHRAGAVTNTDLLKVDDSSVVCFGRMDESGELTKLNPPQTIVPADLKDGAGWDYDSEIGGMKVHQHCAVMGDEDVVLPAGKFRASKIHIEQSEPGGLTEDRWFVKGVGIVKDVTTLRNADGDLLKRVTLELQELPKVGPRPAVNTRKLSGSVSDEAVGPAATKISGKADKIYARWQGSGLRKGAKIRVVWIAENVGDAAAPNYTIDEATTAATASNSHGLFTLARPEDGWTPGDYRVEFYLDDALVDTVKLKIEK